MAKVILPVRSREFGVGKEMGGSIYLHRNYEHLLGEFVATAKRCLPEEYNYNVVKFNRKTGAVSFVESPDFDISPEPSVGDVWTISLDGTAKLRRRLADPYIYHHKWLMVAEEYGGFDIDESRERSQWWLAFDGVNKQRISRRSWWNRLIAGGIVDMTAGPFPHRFEGDGLHKSVSE